VLAKQTLGAWSSERRVVGRPSYLIFAQYYSETGAGLRPECTFFNPPHQPLVDFAGEELPSDIAPAEFGELVEIAIVELREHRLQRVKRTADITNDDAIGIERVSPQFSLNNERRAVQLLSRPENVTDQLWAIMKWWLTVMLYMPGPRGSMIPECVTKDVCGRQMRIQSGKIETHFRRAESEGS